MKELCLSQARSKEERGGDFLMQKKEIEKGKGNKKLKKEGKQGRQLA